MNFAPQALSEKNFRFRENRERSLLTVKPSRYRGRIKCRLLCMTRPPSTATIFSVPGVEGKRGPKLISWRLRANEFVKYFQNSLLRAAR